MQIVSLARWILVLVVAGCNNGSAKEPYKRAAQEELTNTFSCPKERVTTTLRSDLKAFDLEVGMRDKPPADIAADPGRLEVWKKHQQEIEDASNNGTVIETRGCDAHVFYVCRIGEGSNGSQVYVCHKAEHPPA